MCTSDVDKYQQLRRPQGRPDADLGLHQVRRHQERQSEAGTHSVGYDILGPNDNVPGKLDVRDSMSNLDNAMRASNRKSPLATLAKISLSDVDNSRGYETYRHRLRLQQRHLRRASTCWRPVHRWRAQRRR